MTNYTSNLKTWGDTGEEFPNGYSYAKDEPPVDVWDNFVNYNLIEDTTHLVSVTNRRIESAKGDSVSFPASPEDSHLYHDQEDESLHFWDATAGDWHRVLAADGDQMDGTLDMGGHQLYDSTGNLRLGGNVEVPSGKLSVSEAVGNATYATSTDVPSLSEGEMVYVQDENALYIEDGN